jgi:hypothetical protein
VVQFLAFAVGEQPKDLTPVILREYLGIISRQQTIGFIRKLKMNSVKRKLTLYYDITQKRQNLRQSPRSESHMQPKSDVTRGNESGINRF